MALFKPKASQGSGNKFMGMCEMDILGFTDRSKDFDWADIFLDVEVRVKESDYTRNIRIRGSFEKDGNGNITGGSVLNRMYKFFGDVGCTAGVNIKGTWEDEDGNAIEDIADYLNTCCVGKAQSHPYLAYIYKEENKKSGKTFNSVHYRMFPNNSKGNMDLAEHIKWMKTNGYLKEATPKPAIKEVSLDKLAEEAL